MSKNYYYIIVIIVILIAVGGALYFQVARNKALAPESGEGANQPQSAPSQSAAGGESGSQAMNGGAVNSTGASISAPAEIVVSYTGAGYSPEVVNIKAGDTVVFKNDSIDNMWPASGMHPTHTVYPTTGGCLGSTFDACKGIGAGGFWSFKFDIKGAWGYHDHLNPGARGKVIVE